VDHIVSILITKNALPYITTPALADKKSSVAITSKVLAVITSHSLNDITSQALTSSSHSLNDITSESLTSSSHSLNDITSQALTSTSHRLNDITSEALTSHVLNDITSEDLTSEDYTTQELPSITVKASVDITLHALTYDPIRKGVIYTDAPKTAVTFLQDYSKEKLHPTPLLQTTTTSW
jgi:hypothetical protein